MYYSMMITMDKTMSFNYTKEMVLQEFKDAQQKMRSLIRRLM